MAVAQTLVKLLHLAVAIGYAAGIVTCTDQRSGVELSNNKGDNNNKRAAMRWRRGKSKAGERK